MCCFLRFTNSDKQDYTRIMISPFYLTQMIIRYSYFFLQVYFVASSFVVFQEQFFVQHPLPFTPCFITKFIISNSLSLVDNILKNYSLTHKLKYYFLKNCSSID